MDPKRQGLDAIADPRARAALASVLGSGLIEEAIARTAPFAPALDQARMRTHAALLTAEFASAGVVVPAVTVENIILMRALMVPIEDPALALALDRIWVFATNLDDVCSHDAAAAETVLRAGMLPGARDGSPDTRYLRYAFEEIAPFCDPTFLPSTGRSSTARSPASCWRPSTVPTPPTGSTATSSGSSTGTPNSVS
ncbi:hypothetical protein [Kitasatospora sp. MMS16-BH015]|uniref:hypothetical protein n=1 Tax=Kitasatospora sp. MMS16-BH015 TaxID=2018025 RepID=UPI000CF251FA|nr:hypothetical protein [Kitasatospora sp. MMS16-BH015]